MWTLSQGIARARVSDLLAKCDCRICGRTNPFDSNKESEDMRKLKILPAVAFGVLTLGGAGGSSHTASAAAVDPVNDPTAVDVEVPEPPDQNNGDLPEPPEAEEPDPGDVDAPDMTAVPPEGDVETPGGVDPNESGVTETADLPEADEPTAPEVVDPADTEVDDPAAPADTEVEDPADPEVADPAAPEVAVAAEVDVDDPADPEVADPADAVVPDPVAIDEEEDDDDDVLLEAQGPSNGGATAVVSSGSLPHTGSETSSTAIIGAFVMMIGGVMHRVSSRRETVVR
jgi:LPXTG-motif cell wall-anchored protein